MKIREREIYLSLKWKKTKKIKLLGSLKNSHFAVGNSQPARQ